MKLLQITNTLGTGGAEKLVTEIVPIFQKSGLEVDVLLLNGKQTPLKESLALKSTGKVFSLGNGSVYNPLHIFSLIGYLRNYDIVHVHLFPALYWVAFAKMIGFSKARLVYTEHNTNNRRRDKLIFKIFDKIVYKCYDKIITISDEVDANLKAHLKFSPSKFTMVHNGIDFEFFKNAAGYPKHDFFSENDQLLIQVSSFREQKDQPTLIRAMQFLPDHVKLLLVGTGHLKDSCEQLVKEMGLGNRVVFLGNRTDVEKLLKTSDIIVLSSHYEGLSLSSIEGMASGRPFVASDVPGLSNIVKGAGVLFKQGDSEGLANEIMKLLADNNYYEAVVMSGQDKAKNFDIGIMAQKYMKVYESIT